MKHTINALKDLNDTVSFRLHKAIQHREKTQIEYNRALEAEQQLRGEMDEHRSVIDVLTAHMNKAQCKGCVPECSDCPTTKLEPGTIAYLDVDQKPIVNSNVDELPSKKQKKDKPQ